MYYKSMFILLFDQKKYLWWTKNPKQTCPEFIPTAIKNFLIEL